MVREAFRKLTLVAVVLGLISTACATQAPAPPPTAASQAQPTAASQAPAATQPAAAPATAAAPTATAVKQPTGELKIALANLAEETLDPIFASARGKFFQRLIFDFLVGTNPDGSTSKDTGLAKDWTLSPDQTTYTFQLRQGVKFHNGDEVTADDVKYSLDRLRKPEATASYAASIVKMIKDVTVVDKYTVRVQMAQPYIFLPFDLSNAGGTEGLIVPKKYIEEKGDKFLGNNPIGSGPYKFVEQRTGSYLVVEAVPNHWRLGMPKYKTIRLLLAPEESTRVAMLKTGQADVVSIGVGSIKDLEKSYSVLRDPGSGIAGLWYQRMFDTSSLLSDKRIRQALSMGINRQEIADFIFSGQAQPAAGPLIAGPWMMGFPKTLQPDPYDPTKAKQLLADAGYPNGIDITISSYSVAQVPQTPQIAEAIAGYWSRIGVRAKVVPTDWTSLRALIVKKDEKLKNTVGVHASDNRPFAHLPWQSIYHSKGAVSSVADPQLDAMIDSVQKASSMDQYAELQGKVINYLADNHIAPAIVTTGQVFAAASDKVKQWNTGKNQMDINIEDLFTQK